MGAGIDLAATRDGAGSAGGGRVTFDSQGETAAGRLFPAAPVTRRSAASEEDQPRNTTRRRTAPHTCHQAPAATRWVR